MMLTVQAADAHRVATRRQDWRDAYANAALSRYAADLREARRWALTRPVSRAQRAADRYVFARKVAEAHAELLDELARIGVR